MNESVVEKEFYNPKFNVSSMLTPILKWNFLQKGQARVAQSLLGRFHWSISSKV